MERKIEKSPAAIEEKHPSIFISIFSSSFLSYFFFIVLGLAGRNLIFKISHLALVARLYVCDNKKWSQSTVCGYTRFAQVICDRLRLSENWRTAKMTIMRKKVIVANKENASQPAWYCAAVIFQSVYSCIVCVALYKCEVRPHLCVIRPSFGQHTRIYTYYIVWCVYYFVVVANLSIYCRLT